jgi:hypothetical protein
MEEGEQVLQRGALQTLLLNHHQGFRNHHCRHVNAGSTVICGGERLKGR